jgi:uncharacterized RDD family membrane protein YckC
MNIENSSSTIYYAKSFPRLIAAAIDGVIVLIIRCLTIFIIDNTYLKSQLTLFIEDFEKKFGTYTPKNTAEHISYILHHQFFIITLLSIIAVILVGAFYHAYLNSSSWQATIGKRFMNVIMQKNNDDKTSFYLALSHYFLSIMPYIYIIYIVAFAQKYETTFYQAITYSNHNIFFGILFVLWCHIQSFTKRKTTAYDLICNIEFIKGKTEEKYPWS